jgi:hypothetical protein
VIDGGYIHTVFEMAVEEYKSEMEQFVLPEYKPSDFQ